jgi:Tfp pilus assembly protein FimT
MKVRKVKHPAGYTVVELLICLAGLATLALMGGIVYVVIHFLAKLW